MNDERATIVSRLLPDYDDTITRAQWSPDVVPLPPPIVREQQHRVDVEELVDEEWRTDAACADQPDLWFFPPMEGAGRYSVEVLELEQRAKDVCATCIVRAHCLTFALANEEEYGIWGGLTPRERAQVRRRSGMRLLKTDFFARHQRRRRRIEGLDERPPPRRRCRNRRLITR